MAYQIKKAAVLGSGVMGSGIAAHLANIGIPVLLLDIVPGELTADEEKQGLTLEDRQVRNRFATGALQKLMKQKPAPLTTKKNMSLIEAGNLEDDVDKLKDVDWIIEVVVENLDVKKSLYEKIDAVRSSGTIVTSNTSGISIEAMMEGRSEDIQKHFLGTHFFNPPRYLKLLEVIPASTTAPEVVDFMVRFGEDTLGKGVVIAKDTPNFIANRIGTYGLLVTLREMEKRGYSIGEVDSVTGTLIGRPKSATFRTLDVVGLDTFVHVAKNVYDHTDGEEQQVFDTPEFMKKMVENGWLGAKTKQGFYVKKGKEILELDRATFEYVPTKKLKTPSIEMAKQQKGLGNRVKTLIYSEDRTGEILWSIFAPTLLYSAELNGEIADDIVAIDNAMKWGFGWQQGPFETWDAIGVKTSVEKMKAEGFEIPSFVQSLLEKGYETFYKEEDGERFFFNGETYEPVPVNEKVIDLKQYKKKHGVIKKNSGASLIDLGDGVALLEFHSQSNAIGLDIIQMINFAIEEVEKNYKGLVIGNQGKNFCVGANLGLILMEAQDDNIFELDFVIRSFQQAMMNIKYAKKPVVAAPFAMTLGGGAEVCLPAAHIQATTETYMGLVEVGVGLIPGGGGNVNLYTKHLKGLPNGVDVDYQNIANKVFETIAMAKVSTSGDEARENNFLDFADGISVNGDHQIYDAKQVALALYENGYKAPKREKVPVTGESGYATLLLGAEAMHLSGYISDHDLKIAKKLAYVIAGGKVPYGTFVDEQYLLDLEREAFLSLVADPMSQQRMQHMLIKGKPLRN
ncbi:3-hydroxyacyl-CoA dehydrogenase/enoyl-CoA hydratase family protein [Sporosarcina pasteurii]|uniref:Probable 3-hydroxyacyl-CoA dehydrogenase n=1 Tax=Sporosarcina pasteurii TaxID=1474 RepID=A0A380CAG3_SPOPA|nr:3-hydroxyacyl-CoA dehydrogenase/enoyl-CoA hydratase family protein [Sporosarcina pasteurii]MDS9472744.1 3-hydroxyacyl-CoA dehydrogenase/enoyl-CoA hydratase family protein [Sporosarcina pasteurii]QBQ04396.1 3-hydroxyacyl-CoA dehydrogenase/enoyl-CoA hydratase family protein [Sporosarcina pasteurii]SUJ15402.1 Probable 3-hydroxyacyl-CoA dehydrogenase [Sporosarcina pasteurii]